MIGEPQHRPNTVEMQATASPTLRAIRVMPPTRAIGHNVAHSWSLRD
jgi:hypothetical protein